MSEITSAAKSTNTNSLIVNKNPIYQATGGTSGVTKLKSAGFPQEVESIFENGTINGVGKVTTLKHGYFLLQARLLWSWSNNYYR